VGRIPRRGCGRSTFSYQHTGRAVSPVLMVVCCRLAHQKRPFTVKLFLSGTQSHADCIQQ
jgi:hypothetical protein